MLNKEEKCKELLEKIKQTPNNVIEEAIDKLHIEYIKDSKEYIEHEIKTGKLINGYTDIYIFQTEVELLLKYIQHLEQKESILDKVTDELKEGLTEAKEQIKYWEEQYRIAKEKEDEFYMKSYLRRINRWQSGYETLKGILEFIEGEKE